MAKMTGVLGTIFGGFVGMYILLLFMGVLNGLSVRFMGYSVQQKLNETVGGLV